MALDNLFTSKAELVFISPNQWDISGASSFGLDCIWVNRSGETKEVLPYGNCIAVNDLMDIIELV